MAIASTIAQTEVRVNAPLQGPTKALRLRQVRPLMLAHVRWEETRCLEQALRLTSSTRLVERGSVCTFTDLARSAEDPLEAYRRLVQGRVSAAFAERRVRRNLGRVCHIAPYLGSLPGRLAISRHRSSSLVRSGSTHVGTLGYEVSS